MYDALISTWNYKYQYNRPAPYKVDESIIPSYPDNNLPSYPSEDAVIATVAEQILIFMFPLETDYILERADDLRNSRLWSGMNVQSNLDAGDALGYSLASIFLGRAKNDSMRFAQVEEEEYILMEQNAALQWEGQWNIWENLEIPQRPIGITPKFGSVIPWWIPNVETVRPGPPPLPGSSKYNEDVNELLQYADGLTNEQKKLHFSGVMAAAHIHRRGIGTGWQMNT